MNNEILRLLNNIKTLVNANALDNNFEVFADDKDIETIEDLNEAIESEISYWAENQ